MTAASATARPPEADPALTPVEPRPEGVGSDAVRAARSRSAAPPRLTGTGRALLVGAVAVIFVAATAGHVALLTIGTTMLALLSAAWLTTREAARAIDTLELWLDTPEGATRARTTPITLRVRVIQRGRRPLRDVHLAVRLVGAESPRALFDAPASAEADLDFVVPFPRAGHWRVHGVELTASGLFDLARTRRYRPAELAINIRPRRRPQAEVQALLAGRGAARDRAGRHIAGRTGSGLELREMRDYVPGDALKTVAWKATARRRRPLVRAFEEETVRRMQLIVDIGPAMRAGPEGRASLDRAIDLCATIAEHAVHDRIGLTTFDHRIYGHLRPAGGREHLQRQLHHLMDLARVVDEDLTEIGDAELLARVGAFIETQEGVAVGRNGPDPWRSARTLVDPLAELYDVGALFAHVTRYLAVERDRGHRALFAKNRPAKETLAARLRLFCALRGLPISYRLSGPLDAFETGLVDALAPTLRPGGADRIILFSDLRGLEPDGPAARALRLTRARKKQLLVVVLSPEPPAPHHIAIVRKAHGRLVHLPPGG